MVKAWMDSVHGSVSSLTQSYTVSSTTETPVLAMISMVSATSADTAASYGSYSVGFTDGTNDILIVSESEDNVSTSNTTNGASTTIIAGVVADGGGTTDVVGTFSQFVAGGIEIDWSSTSSTWQVMITLWFGDNVEATVGTVTPNAVGGADKSVSLTHPFQHGIFLATGGAFDGSLRNNAALQFTHVIDDGTSDGDLRHTYYYEQDNQSNADVRLQQLRTINTLGDSGVPETGTPTADVETRLVAITATGGGDGFRVESAGSLSGTGPAVGYAVISYGDDNDVYLDVRTGGTTSGNVQYNGVGFRPWAGVGVVSGIAGTPNVWNTTTVGGTGATIVPHAFLGENEEFSANILADDNASTTATTAYAHTQGQEIRRDTDASDTIKGNFVQWNSDGYTINYTTPRERDWFYVFLEQDTYTGSVAGTLGGLTSSSDCIQVFSSTTDGDLAPLEGSASAIQAFEATSSALLAATEGAGTGTLTIFATSAGVLAGLEGAGTATARLEATSDGVLGVLTSSATGVMTIFATSSASLAALTGSATATSGSATTTEGPTILTQLDPWRLVQSRGPQTRVMSQPRNLSQSQGPEKRT